MKRCARSMARYALQDAVVCRRRAAGDLAWNWNIGVISPALPPQTPACAGAPPS